MEIFDQPGEQQTIFAQVLLPVPIHKFFTYRIPLNLNAHVEVGKRVIVQFGDRKILTGIIAQIGHTPPTEYEAKYILELLDDFPAFNEIQFKLFQWIADYYLCTLGEVLNAAMPSGLKLSSESMVQLNPAFSLEESNYSFSEHELILLRRLEQETLTYSEISKLLGIKTLYNLLKSLASKEAVILFEEVKEKFRPKTEKKIRLNNQYNDHKALEELFKRLSAKPKQEAVLLKYLALNNILQDASLNTAGVSKKKLVENEISETSLQTLIKSKVFEEFEVILSRFEDDTNQPQSIMPLSYEQHTALNEILKSFGENNTTLLHGITGSGKTEVYINLIKQAIESGNQVLYLLPEIALTTQIVVRLKKVFGNAMGVYHSKFSDNERVEVWNGVNSGRYKFVAGVRSSIFLPFDNLGLIVVDEEHDPSYKQQEPAPRYHARDVAVVLGQLHHAKVLLGSATPSLETYFNTQQKKYGLVKLLKRFGEAQLPLIRFADMTKERKLKTTKGDFSGYLLKSIEDTLAKKEQIIIFQNRRGYAPMISCEDCGWVPKCINCAVSLTYHQFKNALICHYCGYRESLPNACPTCTSTRIKTVGYGTEKLEEELILHFPDARVKRMDLDTTRTKTGYESIIEEFEKGETNILVGTQMVTKGLDFDHVSLVGIFNADRMIHFPDFRSYERAYQLITQVSGRAGRREKQGVVVIQTSNPEHPLLQSTVRDNYDQFYAEQILDRQRHGYPPFSRLIEITVKHIDKRQCKKTAEALAQLLNQQVAEAKILGPGEPMISKIRNQYLMSILIKIVRGKINLTEIKHQINNTVNELRREKEHRNSKVIIDVDPI